MKTRKIIHVNCYDCNSKAIALQDDIPTCLQHFSKLIYLKRIRL